MEKKLYECFKSYKNFSQTFEFCLFLGEIIHVFDTIHFWEIGFDRSQKG